MAEAAEIIIKYNEPAPIDHLIWFATEKCKPEQRLVIDFDFADIIIANEITSNTIYNDNQKQECLETELNKIIALKEQHSNIAIKMYLISGKIMSDFIQSLKDNKIAFFLNYLPQTIAEVVALVKYGVSDIYITNYLGFNLTDIKKIAENVNIRVYPNVAQNPPIYDLTGKSNDNLKAFFIRPEDLELYGDYVDIVEFYGAVDKQDVLMDIYKDGYWMGNLNELILDFKEDINCMNLMPDFGFYRLACGHRCDLGKCNYCDISKSLAAELKAKDIYIKKERKDRTNEYNANEESSFNDGAEAI
jgi:hypothetical protein